MKKVICTYQAFQILTDQVPSFLFSDCRLYRTQDYFPRENKQKQFFARYTDIQHAITLFAVVNSCLYSFLTIYSEGCKYIAGHLTETPPTAMIPVTIHLLKVNIMPTIAQCWLAFSMPGQMMVFCLINIGLD